MIIIATFIFREEDFHDNDYHNKKKWEQRIITIMVPITIMISRKIWIVVQAHIYIVMLVVPHLLLLWIIRRDLLLLIPSTVDRCRRQWGILLIIKIRAMIVNRLRIAIPRHDLLNNKRYDFEALVILWPLTHQGGMSHVAGGKWQVTRGTMISDQD